MIWSLLRRIRAAAGVLFLPGDRMPVTRQDLVQLRSEWVEWETTFNGILEKLNAWNARQAKREKRALEAQMAQLEDGLPEQKGIPNGARSKRELYRQAVSIGQMEIPALGPVDRLPPPPPPPDPEEAP